MKVYLIISLLLLLCASENSQSYFAIYVPTNGTITVTSSWGNSATVKLVYDVGGINQNIPLNNGSPTTFTVASTGKKLIYIDSGSPNPTNFAISLTMPNGDVYTLSTTFLNNFNSAFTATPGVCENNYQSVYASQPSPPKCQPICRYYFKDNSKIAANLCSVDLSVCALSCNVVLKCGNGIVDAGENCDNGNQVGCSANCQVDSGYFCTDFLNQPSVC